MKNLHAKYVELMLEDNEVPLKLDEFEVALKELKERETEEFRMFLEQHRLKNLELYEFYKNLCDFENCTPKSFEKFCRSMFLYNRNDTIGPLSVVISGVK
jgi:hypothetical protein